MLSCTEWSQVNSSCVTIFVYLMPYLKQKSRAFVLVKTSSQTIGFSLSHCHNSWLNCQRKCLCSQFKKKNGANCLLIDSVLSRLVNCMLYSYNILSKIKATHCSLWHICVTLTTTSNNLFSVLPNQFSVIFNIYQNDHFQRTLGAKS